MSHIVRLSGSDTEPVNLDLKDKKIMAILVDDARISLTQLAKKVGLKRETADYRVKKLIENKGELIDRETMIKAVWPKNLYETSEHALDQMIHRLRKKMESATPKCALLTFRGRGAKIEIKN